MKQFTVTLTYEVQEEDEIIIEAEDVMEAHYQIDRNWHQYIPNDSHLVTYTLEEVNAT